MELPDVQSRRIEGEFKLTRVGVKGVKKPIEVIRPDRRVPMVLSIDAYVDLPSTLRGVHMSRNIESINEVLDLGVRREVQSIEELAGMMASDLLERHDYATYSEVMFDCTYFLERESPTGARCLENYRLMTKAVAERGGPVSRTIGVEVIGTTACPCGIETTRKLTEERLGYTPPELWLTHNQRNVTRLFMDIPEGKEVEADELIDILEGSVSAPTHEILKRQDEAEIILKAHMNPKFVEDVVRDILAAVVERFSDLPDDVCIIAQSESEESIHKHNAYAERSTTLGSLRSGGGDEGCGCTTID